MTLLQRKKTAPTPEPDAEPTSEKPRLEAEVELFALASGGGDGNLMEANRLLRRMTATERRALRESLERLDEALDWVALEAHMAWRVRRNGSQRHARPSARRVSLIGGWRVTSTPFTAEVLRT